MKQSKLHGWRLQWNRIIFFSDTKAGKLFDIILLFVILFSVLTVMAESVEHIKTQFGSLLTVLEWLFTIFFTLEYAARLITAERPLRYAFSFLGLIDFFAAIPPLLFLFSGMSPLVMMVRIFRMLRIFTILKLARYLGEAHLLIAALKASRYRITVFVIAVISIVTVMGTMMYVIEGPQNGFTSIPRGIYWAVITLTTVGYGDIVPRTVLGQTISSIIMMLGYAMIAIPTGMVSVSLGKAVQNSQHRSCPVCGVDNLDITDNYCRKCGAKLP